MNEGDRERERERKKWETCIVSHKCSWTQMKRIGIFFIRTGAFRSRAAFMCCCVECVSGGGGGGWKEKVKKCVVITQYRPFFPFLSEVLPHWFLYPRLATGTTTYQW